MLPCTGPCTKEKTFNTFIKSRSLYETIIRPDVTCGAESWTLTNKMERNLKEVGKENLEKNIWANM
jgi:hypothetical protein